MDTPMKKITMGLTETDVGNAEAIAKLANARNKAQAVSTSLSIAALLLKILVNEKGKIIIEKPDGTTQQLIIPGLLQNG